MEVVLYSLLAASLASVITFLATKKAVSGHYKNTHALDYEIKKNSLVKEVTGSVLQGDQYKDKLELEYMRGKEDGHKAELHKFDITYEPYEDLVEDLFGMRKRAEVGYITKFFYSGFQIGPSYREVTHRNVEYDQVKIEKIFNSEVAGIINNFAQMAITKGVSAKVLPPIKLPKKP